MEFNHPLNVRRARKRLADGWRIELTAAEETELQQTGTQRFSCDTVSVLCQYVGADVETVQSM